MKHLTAILLMLGGSHALSQPVLERVILFPDRNLYISGETVQFSAFIRPENNSAAVSRIMYCELIAPGGGRMAGGKYAAINSTVSGELVIPPDLISGVYYLKAYTRSMRNEGPSVYSYDYIKVINPDRPEVNAGTGNESMAEEPGRITPDTMIRNWPGVPPTAFPGETLKIMIEDPAICNALKNLTFSVIPEHTFSDRIISPPENVSDENSQLPEINGILITGIVKDRSGDSLIPGIKVNLSITGEGRDFLSAITGRDGRFVFSIPDYCGSRDIFLSTESSDSLDAQILVDNDFCNLPVVLPDVDFEISDAERETALTMAVNFRLDKYFNDDSLANEGIKSEETKVFYGRPDKILSMDDFVQLPTLEEYFNQIPVPVKVRKRSGHKYFKVLGTQSELMENDPLVMVDLVVIDDPEKILALDPREIKRIEIVNALYIKSDFIYGGIISIISRHGDFAGISLPSSGIFINYPFLNNSLHIREHRGINPDIPDTRNTFCWKVVRSPDECYGISFSAPMKPGRYMVVTRGVDGKGDQVSGISTFFVKGL